MIHRRQKPFDHVQAQALLGVGAISPLGPLRAEPTPSNLLGVRSRMVHKATSTHDVYEHYECVGGVLLLMKVERVPR